MNRRGLITALAVSALCVASLSGLGARPALAACGSGATSLQNGGFESPPVAPNTFTLFPAASVPPWLTTDSLNEIEIWGTGYLGVPAAQGNAFAEINANSAGTLYQDVVSNPGDTMTWTLEHRGRSGNDTMEVLIGDATVADVNGNTGWDYTSPGLTDGTAAWGTHTNTYVVPAGQTCTRFAFRAVSTASGNDSIGNFLDDVSFAIAPAPTPTATPTPTPTPTGTPGPTPTPTAAATATPGPTPTPTGTPDPGSSTSITPPPTDTSGSIIEPATVPIVPIAAVLLVGLVLGLGLVGRRVRPRR